MVPFMVWCWCCVEPPGEKKLIDLEDIPEIFYSPQIKKIKFLKLPRYPARDKGRVREMYQSCQTWPAKFGQIWLRTDTRLVFCNRKLMKTDILFTRTTKPICNFANFARDIISSPRKKLYLDFIWKI
jgi:hypothetical protein